MELQPGKALPARHRPGLSHRRGPPLVTSRGSAAHIEAMTFTGKQGSPAAVRARALLCIVCSGGCRDANGAYTLCALCDLQGAEAPGEALEAA